MDTQLLRLVVTGHVDHGKSTVTGRLLADTSSLPEGKLESIRDYCERNAKPFEYAFLLDALKDERAQGITIDTARIFFKTDKRGYVILDTPGHIEFLRNMVTGAAHADAAVLVIDAFEGLRENSFRHGYLLSFLGIRQIAVLVNKMDLTGYNRSVFEGIERDYRQFLQKLGIEAAAFIPASAMNGDSISTRSENMPWYTGPTLLEMLDSFSARSETALQAFRMPVQDVYRFTRDNDTRRIIAGTIASGNVHTGDEVVFYPSGKRSFVKTIESFPPAMRDTAKAGEATGFTLTEQIYIGRGELAAKAEEKAPEVTNRFRAHIFWLGKKPLTMGKTYLIKLGSLRVEAQLEEIIRKIDAVTLSEQQAHSGIEKNEAAECVVKTARPIAFDVAHESDATSRFVIVDEYDIRGGGSILEALPDSAQSRHRTVMIRNTKWASGLVDREQRAERHGHKPQLVIITGLKDSGKKALARELEYLLFSEGRLVFFMGIANLLYGMDADIARTASTRAEHIRRLSEMANIMLEAGHILIVTAVEITGEDLAVVTESIPREEITLVWVGEKDAAGMQPDQYISAAGDSTREAARIRELLIAQGVITKK